MRQGPTLGCTSQRLPVEPGIVMPVGESARAGSSLRPGPIHPAPHASADIATSTDRYDDLGVSLTFIKCQSHGTLGPTSNDFATLRCLLLLDFVTLSNHCPSIISYFKLTRRIISHFFFLDPDPLSQILAVRLSQLLPHITLAGNGGSRCSNCPAHTHSQPCHNKHGCGH